VAVNPEEHSATIDAQHAALDRNLRKIPVVDFIIRHLRFMGLTAPLQRNDEA
jgi:hypothetical protein